MVAEAKQQILDDTSGHVSSDRLIQSMSLTNKTLQLIVMPTEQCNFRCTYCYEDFSIGNMKAETVSAVIKLIESRASELNELHVSYFGGEPLLNMKAVRQINLAAEQIMSEKGKFSSDMTTNGFLLNEEIFEELNRLHCTYFQVSLDGFGEGHDATRRSRNGLPNFDIIWSNLLKAKQTELNFKILLRIHLRPGGEESTCRLMENIRDHLCDSRFAILFKEIFDWGGKDPNHPEVFRAGGMPYADFLQAVKAIEQERQESFGETKRPDLPMTPTIGKEGGDGPFNFASVCYAAKANSLLVRANGRIGKCTVALKDARNDVGKLNADGTISFDSTKLAPWLSGLTTMDRAALTCPAAVALR